MNLDRLKLRSSFLPRMARMKKLSVTVQLGLPTTSDGQEANGRLTVRPDRRNSGREIEIVDDDSGSLSPPTLCLSILGNQSKKSNLNNKVVFLVGVKEISTLDRGVLSTLLCFGMKATDRKNALFQAIIKEHIKTAKPVGSEFLVEKCGLKCSPATARNYMADLEKEGLIHQPHTSAGRVPTARGYQYYLDHFFTKDNELLAKHSNILTQIAKQGREPEQTIKNLAKGMAELAQETVVLSLEKNSFYYTGISNLFQKPEFRDIEVIYNLSEIIDQFDEVMTGLHEKELKAPEIMVGEKNPFSPQCSLVMAPYNFKHGLNGVFGILGPMRMDYGLNYSLIKYINNFNKNER